MTVLFGMSTSTWRQTRPDLRTGTRGSPTSRFRPVPCSSSKARICSLKHLMGCSCRSVHSRQERIHSCHNLRASVIPGEAGSFGANEPVESRACPEPAEGNLPLFVWLQHL